MGIKGRWIKGVGFVEEQTAGGENTFDLSDAALAGSTPGPKAIGATRTASATLTSADVGMNVLSGSGDGTPANDIVITLPDPADVPLAMYGFRSEDARNHVISSSAPGSVLAFSPPSGSFGIGGADTVAQSSHISMSAEVGSSLLLQSDGLHYLMYAASGTHLFQTD